MGVVGLRLLPGFALCLALPACLDEPLPEELDPADLRVINSDAIETDIAVTPDGRTLLFSRRGGEWGNPSATGTIFVRRKDETGSWQEAKPASFSGTHSDSDPFVTLDGRYVYFISNRPTPDKSKSDPDIWRAPITQEGFGTPERLPEPVNSTGVEYSPVTVANGALYFASTREGGLGQGDLYRSGTTVGGFAPPENLGPSVNSRYGEWNLYVSPEEDFLIFEGSGRQDNVGNGSGDLYAALKVDGEWALTRNLRRINSTGSDLMPRHFPNAVSGFYYASAAPGSSPPDMDIQYHSFASVFSHFDRLLVVNRSAHEVCAVTVPAFISLGCTNTVGYGPVEITVSPDTMTAYVPNNGVFPRPHPRLIREEIVRWEEKPGGGVAAVNTDRVASFHRWRLHSDCSRPHGVATDGERLWITCEDSGTVLQMNAGQWLEPNVQKGWKIGQRGVHELKLSPDGRMLVTANFDSGTVTLIDLKTERMTTLKVGDGPEGMAFAPGGRHLFVLNARSDSLSVVNMDERKVTGTVPTGGRFPIDIAVAAEAKEIWISHNASRDLTILNLNAQGAKQKIELGWQPLGLILSDDEQWVFVTVPRRNEVWAYDRATRERRAVIPDMMEADGLAFVPARPDP